MKVIKIVFIYIIVVFTTMDSYAQTSQCYGTTSNGRIYGAKQLPVKGDNFVIYNELGNALGRNYVHSTVYDVVVNTFAKLAGQFPKTKYKYAETGWKNGGSFKPHKTHQNGLSVDFMVPVINEKGQSIYFSTTWSNKFGYAVEFDKDGNFQKYKIDFEAIALHLVQVHKSSIENNIEIKRVIFAPEFRKKLAQTSQAKYLQKYIKFMKNKAWVRHDEHYHIDFEIICKN